MHKTGFVIHPVVVEPNVQESKNFSQSTNDLFALNAQTLSLHVGGFVLVSQPHFAEFDNIVS